MNNMDNVKITNNQLFSITANSVVGGAVIVISAAIAGIAKQDAWIVALLTPIFGMPVIWIYWFLGSQYPGMTFIGIIKGIFGKWIGLCVAAGYVFLCLEIAVHVPWYVGNFITTQAMPETPLYVINLLFVTAVVIAVLSGIEAIARASEIFIYFASFLFFLAMVLVLPNAKIENLEPVLAGGIVPILKGSLLLSCIITFPIVTLMMIYPVNLQKPEEAKKPLLVGYLWAGFMVFITILMTILVLGSAITAKYQYPTYLLVTEIQVGTVFTRLEFLVIAIWIVTEVIIGILFFYAGVTGMSELFGLKDHKKIVLPVGLITLIMSGVVFPDSLYEAEWISFVWPPYIITYGLIVPCLLTIIVIIKKWMLKD